jgi:hypothetical protein
MIDINDPTKGYREPDAQMDEESFGPYHEP